MSEAKKKANANYEPKRDTKLVSFNTETEKELIEFAESVVFSKWVKQAIKEEIEKRETQC